MVALGIALRAWRAARYAACYEPGPDEQRAGDVGEVQMRLRLPFHYRESEAPKRPGDLVTDFVTTRTDRRTDGREQLALKIPAPHRVLDRGANDTGHATAPARMHRRGPVV